MTTISLIAIDNRVIEYINTVATSQNWTAVRMGPFQRNIDRNWLTRHNAHVPPEQEAEYQEFILSNVDFDTLHNSLRTTIADLANRRLFWQHLDYNLWQGVDITVCVGFRQILGTPGPPRQQTARAPLEPEENLWLDTEDEDEIEDEIEYDPDEDDYPRAAQVEVTGPAPFDVIPPDNNIPQAMPAETYNQYLQTLREVDMPLTLENVHTRSPMRNCGVDAPLIKRYIADNFEDFNRPITFLSPGANAYFENPEENHLYIIHFSTPNLAGSRSVQCNPREFLTPAARAAVSNAPAFPPVQIPFYNETTTIKDPTTGFALAQLFNQKYLYILFQALGNGSNREYEVFNYIVTSAIASMSSIPNNIRTKYQNEKEKIDREIIEKQEKQLQETVMRMFTTHIESLQSGLRVEINRLKSKTETLQVDISNTYRTLQSKMAEFDGIRRKFKDQQKNIDPKSIFSHPRIKTIKPIANDGIQILTDTVFFTVPDNELVFELGEMKLQIYFRTDMAPMIFNTTRLIDAYEEGMQHPHIFANGAPCWGNVHANLTKLCQQGDIKTYIDLVIAYLETVNLRDAAGAYYYRWPVASAKHQTKETYKEMAEKIGRDKGWEMIFID